MHKEEHDILKNPCGHKAEYFYYCLSKILNEIEALKKELRELENIKKEIKELKKFRRLKKKKSKWNSFVAKKLKEGVKDFSEIARLYRKEQIKKATKKLNEKCDCGLKPKHSVGDHDWCCQICGGNHIEEICPHGRLI